MNHSMGRTSLRGRVLSCCAALVLSACASAPDYQRPAVAVPAAWKNMEGWKLATPGDHLTRGPWWEVFGDANLNALVSQVEVSNPNVQIATAQYRQARALTDQARAGLYPSLGATASATRSGNGGAGTLSGNASSSGSYRLGASVSWEADVWGRLSRGVDAREAGLAASAADLDAARLSAQALLARNYFQLRLTDAQKVLYDATLAAYGRSLELTRNRYKAGVAARTDVIQAETLLRSTQVPAMALAVTRNQLENAIAVLIGKPPAALAVAVLADQPLAAALPAVPAPGLPSALLERRPDIAAAERRMAAANANIGVAEAAIFPTLTLSASSGLANAQLANLLSAPSRVWSLGPALAATLFDAGLRRAQTEQARASYDVAVATYRQAVLNGFREVEDNLIALRVLAEEAQAQDEAVRAARLAVDLITNQYKAGLVSYLNVVTAQATALSNERSALNILGNQLDASVLLITALGGSWAQRP